jgi:cytosolic 5'-nucleotidase 3
VFNKNEAAAQGSAYYEALKERTHIILMGDSLGDLRMSEGIPHVR